MELMSQSVRFRCAFLAGLPLDGVLLDNLQAQSEVSNSSGNSPDIAPVFFSREPHLRRLGKGPRDNGRRPERHVTCHVESTSARV